MSGSCPGVHCPGCGKGGGALAILAALALAAVFVWRVAVKVGHGVEHGVDQLRHMTWEVVEWAAAVLGIAVGLAIVVAALYAASVVIRRRAERRAVGTVPATALTTCTVVPDEVQAIYARAATALDAPKPALPLAIIGQIISDDRAERR